MTVLNKPSCFCKILSYIATAPQLQSAMEHSLFEEECQGQDMQPGNLATAEITLVTLGTVTFIFAEAMGTVPVWKFIDV